MILKSFGCSFIFGTDLADSGQGEITPIASDNTWPALLAKKLGYDYECLARPSSGNLQIAERVLSHAYHDEDVFYVIGWSWIDRFDYTNSDISNRPILARWQNWRTIMPNDPEELASTYYKELHSEFRDKLSSLMYIKLVIDTMKQKGKSFLMTYQDDLLFDQKWNHTPAVIELQNFTKPYMTDFEGQTFLQWSKSQGHKISPALHPLESAHLAAADYLITVVDKQKTNDPVQLVRV